MAVQDHHSRPIHSNPVFVPDAESLDLSTIRLFGDELSLYLMVTLLLRVAIRIVPRHLKPDNPIS